MLNGKRSGVAIAALLVISTTALIAQTAQAKGKKGRGNNGNRNRSTPVQIAPDSALQLLNLSSTQRTILVNLLQGTSDPNNLLSDALRLEIANLPALPPGIQKQLARGRGLPPGIAKKVVLPRTVVQYLNLPRENVDVVILGSTAAIVDPSTNIILDLIEGIF